MKSLRKNLADSTRQGIGVFKTRRRRQNNPSWLDAHIRVDAITSFHLWKHFFLNLQFIAKTFKAKWFFFLFCFFFLFNSKPRHKQCNYFWGLAKNKHPSPMFEKNIILTCVQDFLHTIPVALSGGVDKEFTFLYFSIYLCFRRTKNSAVVVMCTC